MIRQFGRDTLDAITALAKSDHWMQSLLLLYSAIDTVAWACKPAGDITGPEFCAWVEKYMRPETTLGCSPIDLYAARCAVVHSGSSESRLSRKGEALPLWYVTAPARKPELEAFIARGAVKARAIYTGDLVRAFGEGVLQCADEIELDAAWSAQVTARMKQWLAFVRAAPLIGRPSEAG